MKKVRQKLSEQKDNKKTFAVVRKTVEHKGEKRERESKR
jgi:hypothetical protein